MSLEDVEKQIKPTDAELRAYYDKNKQKYANSIPEKRQAKYVMVDSNKILEQAKAQIKPEDLQKYYDDHKEEYRVPEQVKVSHILISPTPGPDGKTDDKALADAKTKAEDILKKLRAGANFADMAKKESKDRGSAAHAGSLGATERAS